MYSNRSEHGHGRPYNDRGSRQWDGGEDRWERREPHRDLQSNSHHKNGVDGYSGTETSSRSRGYSGSPKRPYNKDSSHRERSRKSPARRRGSSPDWAAPEKKKWRTTDDDNDYRYRRVPEDKASRSSPDSFSHAQVSKDFRQTLKQEEDFKYRKASQESRHRYWNEDGSHRQQHDDLTSQRSSGYYKDQDGLERSWDRSPERSSQDRSVKSYFKTRERSSSPSPDRKDRHYYCERDGVQQSAAGPEQKRSTEGFQRFLNVLNKGVNMATLTKVMTQPSKGDRLQSPPSFRSTADRPWSPSLVGRPQGHHQNLSHWSESEGSNRTASPQPRHRSSSPNKRSLSDEKSLQRGDGEQTYFSSRGRSESRSAVERITLPHEDKHKQMQNVLQAIGMNLGYEELGQMSHRIQERLYGKKDGEGGHQNKESRERDTLQTFPSKPLDTSSSRSNIGQSAWEYYKKNDSSGDKRDATVAHQVQVEQSVEYDQNRNKCILPESETFKTNSQQSTAAGQVFSQNPTYPLPEPAPTSVTPMYTPVNCPLLPYAAVPPPRPRLPAPLPSLPPPLPRVGPGFFLPHLPPLLPYQHVPPLNIFPAFFAQTRHLLPQPNSNHQPVFNTPVLSDNTTLKSKTLSRPRCLQVIETKQTG